MPRLRRLGSQRGCQRPKSFSDDVTETTSLSSLALSPTSSTSSSKESATILTAQPCCSSTCSSTANVLLKPSVNDRLLNTNLEDDLTTEDNSFPHSFSFYKLFKPISHRRPWWLSAAGSLLFIFLVAGIFKFSLRDENPPLSRTSLYSGIREEEGQVWILNRHEVRRRRHLREPFEPTRPGHAPEGLAKECDLECGFTLHKDDNALKIYFNRKEFNSISGLNQTETIVPLVQYLESDNDTLARPSALSPLCIYSAKVHGSDESSIVNLCESSGGMVGTLLFPDGAYVIEPLTNGEEKSRSKRELKVKPHLIYKARSQPFEEPLPGNGNTFDFKFENTTKQERPKRAANSWDYYVEVLAVADYKMLVYHQHNLEAYIMTLFSTVASIYRHASLKASVNIIVVRVVVLKHENVGPKVSHHAQDTLQQFCAWQQNFNDRNDDAITHHDVAILLTRHDICRATNKCDTLGLAELGTMCDARKSCAIIEDNGLSAAFTIAHELGHILNIPHDDERRCGRYMPLTKNNYHIMAPTLEYNTNPWAWSPCSSAMLEKFLDNHRAQTQCIFDQPVERRYFDKMFTHPQAGMLYSVNQQCQFVFGPTAEICPYMPTCRRLWCSTYYGFQMGCRTQHMPWADGTPCGNNQWCHRGQCIGISPDKRISVNGGWGEWQSYGACTRTCGGGVQKGVRDCDSPRPMNGGKYCIGQRERYRSCNIHECPYDTTGFREVQCAEFDNKDVGIHGVPSTTKWVPKYSSIAENERCKLYCRARDSAAFYLLKDKVIDGTTCSRNSDDICIGGICHKAGCDHRLGSDMKRDVCGVCGGDGNTCQTVQGAYNEKGTFGYNEVMKIPAGSANIDISQKSYNNQKEDDNYLALRTSTGEFLLNGQYQVSVFRQQIPILDTALEYSGSDHVIERINGTGPIRSDIYLHVLSVGNLNPPHIQYKYMVPKNPNRVITPPQNANYYWIMADDWSQCSARCQGSQIQGLKCMEAATNRPVSDRYCTGKKPEQKQRMCNVDCFFMWQTTPLDACSARCGRGEQRQRSTCVVTTDKNGDKTSQAHEQECITAKLPKPAEIISCYKNCNGQSWSYSEWTTCSATCGTEGVRRRQAVCVDSANRHTDQRYCDQIPKESLESECNRTPCPKWVYGQWNECSRSCGGGIKVRLVSCQDAANRELPSEYCAVEQRSDREKCNEHLCTKWQFGNWTTCSSSCGQGMQTREAKCVDLSGRPLEEGKCDVREKITQKQCNQRDCPHWKIGSWGQCTVSCMDGYRTRAVSCIDGSGNRIPEDYCLKTTNNERPPTHEPCNHGPCPFWRLKPWSTCSVSCGKGIRVREAECVFKDQVVDASLCSDTQLESQKQNCTLLPCALWKVQQWSSCSVSCGQGIQSRTVQCIRGDSEVVKDSECSENKPKSEKSCEKDDCNNNNVQQKNEESPIYWATGPWTECSKRCGKGTQRRQVKCHDHLRELPETYCRHLEKVPALRDCQNSPCVEWKADQWTPCPETCGVQAVQKRKVYCISIEPGVTNITDSDCDPADQPASVRSCNLPACPAEPQIKFGNYKVGEWSSCSVSCGIGYKRRSVYCDSKLCNDSQKPQQFQHCNQGDCNRKNTWQAGPWSSCSVSCGKNGVQHRRVWCQNDDQPQKQVPDLECNASDKPEKTRECSSSLDCLIPLTTTSRPRFKYVWEPGHWSMCSSTCGLGVRVRDVDCVDALTKKNKMSPSLCNSNQKPPTEQRCRQKTCPKWVKEKWSECSVTCGTGIRRREVFCRQGKDEKVDSEQCDIKEKPDETRVCESQKCPSYSWKVTPWTKCVDLCKPSEQHRRVYCVSSDDKRAAPRMCTNGTMPIAKRTCPVAKCPYHWVPGTWSSCSKTCGVGHQFRKLECKVKNKDLPDSQPTVLSRMCMSLEKPAVSKECTLNPCNSDYHWSLGAWSPCSKTCGQGMRKRKIYCLDKENNRVDRELCDQSYRPVKRENCSNQNCLPGDCAELKNQNPSTNGVDGDYTLLITGFRIKVYCHAMNETLPKSYINVDSDSNFAEFYGKRLAYPYSCPFDGKRNDSCDCTNDGHHSAGKTIYTKLRVDLHNMKINPHDFTFARTLHGSPVPFGTAGDCYSMSDCPQGSFSIDLRKSGLKIADDLQWKDHGHRTSSNIERSFNNALIQGACGGYCGECSPDRFKGLVLEVDHQGRQS